QAATQAATEAATEAPAAETKTLYVNQGPTEFFEVPWFNAGPHTYVKAMFETLIGMDNKGAATTEIGMAESYEVAEDGLSAKVTLRDGLMWHDGTPVTADDVIWTFTFIPQYTGACQALVKGGATNIKNMTADGKTITFEFEKVNATQLQAFTQTHILPKHLLENANKEQFQQEQFWQAPIGSGAFKLESAVMGEYANLVPFEGYWGGTPNYNIYVTPSHMDSDPNFVTKVLDGKLDYAYTKSFADVQALTGKPGVTITPVSVLYTRWLQVNQFGQGNQLQDVRVRQAIAYAIDRKAITEQVFQGACDPGDGTITPTGTAWKVEGLEAYDYNPEKAKQLLAEAGWDSSRKLTIAYYYTDQQTVDLISIIQQMLAQVGIQSEGWLVEGDTATLLNSMPEDRANVNSASNVKWDLMYGALAATSFHNYYDRFNSVYGVNNTNPTSPEVDAMTDALMFTPDVEGQKAAYAVLEKWESENLPIIPMYYQPIWVVTSDKVAGNLDLNNLGNPQFHWNMHLEKWNLK
ncbi:MAG: ABC transporter substrate-binding protein, partial [Eubacteriales bacterium]|nr:ABC transporter substrate-binding protein [Eubacteriales bacterium]